MRDRKNVSLRPFTKMSVRGQVVIPKDIRDYLDWDTGDFLCISINPSESEIVLKKVKIDMKGGEE